MDIPQLEDSKLSINRGVALLLFDRDDVRNILTGTAILSDINQVCEWINREPEIGALVISGNGKAFSAGGNIKDMQAKRGMFGGNGFEIQDSYRRGIQKMSLNVHQLEVPVIAAINGPALGAGFDLCCMCDIRIGCELTRLGETFINLGIIPGDGGAWFLPKLVGSQRAAELTFSGRIIDADQALDLGLLLELTTAGKLLETALTLAGSFAEKPRSALRISKRLLQMGQRMPLGDFLDYCASQQSLCHSSDDHRHALEQLISKTSKVKL